MRNIRVLGPSNESRFPVFSRNAYELNIRAVYVCMYKWWSFRQETMCFPMDLITYVFIAYETDNFLKENFHTALMNDCANFPFKVDLLSLVCTQHLYSMQNIYSIILRNESSNRYCEDKSFQQFLQNFSESVIHVKSVGCSVDERRYNFVVSVSIISTWAAISPGSFHRNSNCELNTKACRLIWP